MTTWYQDFLLLQFICYTPDKHLTVHIHDPTVTCGGYLWMWLPENKLNNFAMLICRICSLTSYNVFLEGPWGKGCWKSTRAGEGFEKERREGHVENILLFDTLYFTTNTPSTSIWIFLNLQLFLSGFKISRSHVIGFIADLLFSTLQSGF